MFVLSVHYRTDQIKAEFAKYDIDGNGFVSVAEAHEVLKVKLGFTTIERTQKFLKSCDKNGDGLISYDEFADFFHKVKQRLVEKR